MVGHERGCGDRGQSKGCGSRCELDMFMPAAPKRLELGTRTVTLTKHHAKEKMGVATKGRVQQLVQHIVRGDAT